MAVEIGSLVVRGTFGQPARDDQAGTEELRREMQRLKRQLLQEMREMIDQADRRARER